MNTSEIAQMVGVFMAISIGTAALYIAGNKLRWCSYGRDVLLLFGVYQFPFALNRLLVLLGVMSLEAQLALNTMLIGVFLAILVNLIYMHWMYHHHGLARVDGQHKAEGGAT